MVSNEHDGGVCRSFLFLTGYLLSSWSFARHQQQVDGTLCSVPTIKQEKPRGKHLARNLLFASIWLISSLFLKICRTFPKNRLLKNSHIFQRFQPRNIVYVAKIIRTDQIYVSGFFVLGSKNIPKGKDEQILSKIIAILPLNGPPLNLCVSSPFSFRQPYHSPCLLSVN